MKTNQDRGKWNEASEKQSGMYEGRQKLNEEETELVNEEESWHDKIEREVERIYFENEAPGITKAKVREITKRTAFGVTKGKD